MAIKENIMKTNIMIIFMIIIIYAFMQFVNSNTMFYMKQIIVERNEIQLGE